MKKIKGLSHQQSMLISIQAYCSV